METLTGQSSERVVNTLNSFLRGELSAVESFRMAIERLADSSVRPRLEEVIRSHQARVEILRRRIETLGGQAADRSGPWGAFAKLVQGGANLFGEKSAIFALEEGEDHGLANYRDGIDKLDTESRRLVEAQVLPEQQRTHSIVSTMKHSMHH